VTAICCHCFDIENIGTTEPLLVDKVVLGVANPCWGEYFGACLGANHLLVCMLEGSWKYLVNVVGM
jgi:hypothetical protein